MVVTVAAFVVLVVFWFALHRESRRCYGIMWGWVGRPPSRQHMFVQLVLLPTVRRMTRRMNDEMLPAFMAINESVRDLRIAFDESPLIRLEETEDAGL